MPARRQSEHRPALPLGLDALLLALADDGLYPGPRKVRLLAAALRALEPEGTGDVPGKIPDTPLDRDRLRRLLLCTLASDPVQRNRVADRFELWWQANQASLDALLPPEPAVAPDAAADQPGSDPAGPTASPQAKPPSVPAPSLPLRVEPPPPPRGPAWWHRTPRGVRYSALGLVLLAMPALLLLWSVLRPEQPIEFQAPPDAGTTQGDPSRPKARYSPHYWDWAPTKFEVTPAASRAERPWLALLLAVVAAMALLLLTLRYQSRHRKPDPAPPTLGGSGGRPLLPLVRDPPPSGLLPPRELQRAAWAVERYLGEALTRDLDVPASVRASCAAGGIPALRYRPRRFTRAVWLWQDQTDGAAGGPPVERLIDELAGGLEGYRLPVERGRFWDYPAEVRRGPHERFAPTALEAHRREAWVFVVSDGRGLQRAWDSARERRRVDALLQGLATWPRLYWVDPSDDRYGLAERLAAYRIRCIGPDRIAATLAGQGAAETPDDRPDPPQRPAATRRGGDLELWAAACALGDSRGDGVDAATAAALRDALGGAVGLRLGRSARRDLARAAGGEPLHWPPAERHRLLGWLGQGAAAPDLDACGSPRGALSPAPPPPQAPASHPSTPLAVALAFWRRRLDAEVAAREDRRDRDGVPWFDTPAARELELDRALLDLWDRPLCASKTLTALFKAARHSPTPSQGAIRRRLARYRTADTPEAEAPDSIRLPWTWRRLLDDERRIEAAHRLQKMGLRVPRTERRKRPRPGGALGLGAGLLLGLLAAAGLKVADEIKDPPLVRSDAPAFDTPAFQARSIRDQRINPDGSRTLLAGSPRHLSQVELPAGHRVTIHWTDGYRGADGRPRSNPRLLPPPGRDGQIGDPELWLAGWLAMPMRPCRGAEPGQPWPRRSLALVQATPGGARDDPAHRLAFALLDHGSADRVLLAEDWRPHLTALIGDIDPTLTAPDQLLVLLPAGAPDPTAALRERFAGPIALVRGGDRTKMADALDAERRRGVHRVGAVWRDVPGIRIDAGEQTLLAGRPVVETDPKRGSRFVSLCGGHFLMGSPKEESQYSDERPRHPVTVPAFDIDRTEVTVEQYQDYDPDWRPPGGAGPDQPATYLSWDQARKYCKHYGWRLPTEAEWEYAARGGSDTAWSFGDDPDDLKRFAWFLGNTDRDNRLHNVATRDPNPFGLYDLHGNAWEWVEDCWDSTAYRGRPQGEPSVGPLNAATGCGARVLRGGSAWDGLELLRSAFRLGRGPGLWDRDIGFRCARPRRQP